jgi:hypothetical protein
MFCHISVEASQWIVERLAVAVVVQNMNVHHQRVQQRHQLKLHVAGHLIILLVPSHQILAVVKRLAHLDLHNHGLQCFHLHFYINLRFHTNLRFS